MTDKREVFNVQVMQKRNRLKVLKLVRAHNIISRPEIIRETGLSPSSVTNVISFFLEANLVKETGTVDSKEVGRKAVLIKLNEEAFSVVTVKLDADSATVALTNLVGEMKIKHDFMIPSSLTIQEILDLIRREIIAMIDQFKSTKSEKLPEIKGIGISVSGAVRNSETLVISSSLKWRGVSIREYYEKAFNIPTFIENSSKTKIRSKFCDEGAKLEKNVVFLDLSSGIGIVNYNNGQFIDAITGEIGHTSVKKNGPVCFCGNRGCLELMCSVDNIITQVEKLLSKGKCQGLRDLMQKRKVSVSYELALEAEKAKDPDVCKVIRENGEYLGIGMANIINLFNPERLIINGGDLFRSELLHETAISVCKARAFKDFINATVFETIKISNDDIIRGIALNVADKLFESSDFIAGFE